MAGTTEQVRGGYGRLQASLNALLVRHLLATGPRPIRVFRVAREGRLLVLTLQGVPSALEDKLRRTPQGRAAIAAWERDLLVDLGPRMGAVVEELTGAAVTGGFEMVIGPDGDPTLLLELGPERRTGQASARR